MRRALAFRFRRWMCICTPPITEIRFATPEVRLMKKRTLVWSLAIALVSTAVPAVAAEGWNGDVAFGYTRKSGNTRSSAAALDVNAVLDLGAWRHTANLEYDFESQNRSTTEEDAYLSWKSDYRISEWEYFYGFASV